MAWVILLMNPNQISHPPEQSWLCGNVEAVCHTADFEGFFKNSPSKRSIGPTVGNRVGT